jgi:5-methylcytosine-specific restriction protein B
MQNEIVPLLEEYFYGDYEKIQLVLAGVGYKLEERDIPEELKQYSSKEKLYGKLVKI